MTHAQIRDGAIVAVGAPPSRVYDGETWWDGTDPASGWHPITTDPHPAPQPDHTYTPTLIVRDGLPVREWTSRPLTPEELAHRAELAARLDDHAARLARIEAHLWPADVIEPGQPITAPTWAERGGIWPQQTLLTDGGRVWRNISGVPLTTPPSGFPGNPSQWTRLFVEVKIEPDEPSEPDEWPAWEPWDHVRPLYQVGAPVTHKGRRWIATVGNNHWEPGVYGWESAE